MSLKTEWKKLALIVAVFLACFYLPVGWRRFDNAIMESLHLVKWYAQEHVLLCLIPAFFIAGAISVFVSQASVMKYLGAKANKVLAYGVASVSGTILAVCSCTVLPLFAGIYRMGAGLGPATAFLYSGPAINVLAIILTARILGLELGIARAIGAIVPLPPEQVAGHPLDLEAAIAVDAQADVECPVLPAVAHRLRVAAHGRPRLAWQGDPGRHHVLVQQLVKIVICQLDALEPATIPKRLDIAVGHVVGMVPAGKEQFFKSPALAHIIGAQNVDEFAITGSYPGIDRASRAFVFFQKYRPNAAPGIYQAGYLVPRCRIRRGVIHDDDLKTLKGLRRPFPQRCRASQQTIDGIVQITPIVVAWDYHRQHRGRVQELAAALGPAV